MSNRIRKVYITRELPAIATEMLEKYFQVVDMNRKGPLSKKQLEEVVMEYDAILSTTLDLFDRHLLEKSKNLKAIANYAVGLDNIDLEAASDLGIKVFNLPEIVTNSTADLALALLLSFERQIPQALYYVHSGKWKQWEPNYFVGHEMQDKVFGILGFGRIGQAVAKRALGFGMKVQYSSRTTKQLDAFLDDNTERVSLENLYANADYLCILVPLTDETRGMVDKKVFESMKKDSLLLNMARGQVVKTDDLVEALMNNNIRGAMLDVTDPEPLPGDHPLFQLDNCFVIPHIGTSTIECRETMARKAAMLLMDFFRKF